MLCVSPIQWEYTFSPFLFSHHS